MNCPRCGGIWLDRDELEKAQILVEEWKRKFAQDMETYGAVLEKIQKQTDAKMDKAASIATLPFANLILRGVLNLLHV